MTSTIEDFSYREQITAEELVADIVDEARKQGRIEDVCLTSSFQAEDMIVLHMLRQHVPKVPVIFLETGYHFTALTAYRDQIAREWNLNLVNALPTTTQVEHEAQYGLLHIVDPGKCCQIRKVEPLTRSLELYFYWFTGLRREQSATRANLRKVEEHRLPSGKEMKKISVLADWTANDIAAYSEAHGIPRLSLYDSGYTSIGCEPCTGLPANGADPRSGRWGGKKVECGIHTFSEKH